MQDKSLQKSETFLLSALLSVSGGFQDAYTYVLRDKVFANAQTGNVVLMSKNLFEGEWRKSLHYLLPVLAFAFGIFLSEQIEYRYKEGKSLHWRQRILLIEILLLLAVGLIPAAYNSLAGILVSLSCAMQVQSFRKVRGHQYASTMCIGNLRSGTESLSAYFHEKDKERLKKTGYYYSIILFFALGAGLGCALSEKLGLSAIWISAGLLILSCLLMQKRETPDHIKITIGECNEKSECNK